MNPQLKKLCEIGEKQERLIIGLMSGTSLDGLDVALCRFRGNGTETKVELVKFKTVPYDSEMKTRIKSVFAKKTIDFQLLTLLNPWIALLHGAMILDCLEEWKIEPGTVDLIASHGQTVFHAPKILHGLEDYPNATLQIGDGDHLAVKTGIITLSDFRQKHIAAGGEGAPLAMYGDFLLFSHPAENRILLNMGGIANFTWLPAGQDAAQVFVTDTGPGNTMIDAAVQHFYPGNFFDQDGKIAASGSIHTSLLQALKSDDYFQKPIPKTTGPELFNLEYLRRAQQLSGSENLSPADIIATLTRFSAETIADCIFQNIKNWREAAVYSSGGGAHNPVLMAHLRDLLGDCPFFEMEKLGVAGDAKEAILFAVLANETVAGKPINFGNLPSAFMGKISFPS